MLDEPFTGLWDRRGTPILGGLPHLREVFAAIKPARPCREKIGPLDPMPDDLIWVLPPGPQAPAISDELLITLVDTLERGLAVLVWGSSELAVARAKLAVAMRGCAGRA